MASAEKALQLLSSGTPDAELMSLSFLFLGCCLTSE